MKLSKYSFGIGDRFAHQGIAQLKAIMKAKNEGVDLVPVWNKSNREHSIIGSKPSDTRKEADEAVKKLQWKDPYFVDADHINLKTVDSYIDSADFYTIDVADYIGNAGNENEIRDFIEINQQFAGTLKIPGINKIYEIDDKSLFDIAIKYARAINQAAKIYQHIKDKKGNNDFIPEVSMDEVDIPQTPVELFFILSSLAGKNVPVQTLAPRFSGRFNKGVDYEGDIYKFESEFLEDLMVLDYAVKTFKLPENLKLSVHSGSDKFSIYPVIGKLIKKYDKGIHVKTAGTTWLEEIIGLSLAGNEALELTKEIYFKSLDRIDELTGPYASVISIDPKQLPSAKEVKKWNSTRFSETLRHVPNNQHYNPGFRQLIHVGYKIAAEMGSGFTNMLKKHAGIIEEQVIENIYNRHISRLFLS